MLTSRCTQNDITKDSHVAQLEKGRRAQRADPVLFSLRLTQGYLAIAVLDCLSLSLPYVAFPLERQEPVLEYSSQINVVRNESCLRSMNGTNDGAIESSTRSEGFDTSLIRGLTARETRLHPSAPPSQLSLENRAVPA